MTGFWFKDSSPAAYNSQKVKLRGSPSFHEATWNMALCNTFSKLNVHLGIAQTNDSQQCMQWKTDWILLWDNSNDAVKYLNLRADRIVARCSVSRSYNEAVVLHTHYLFELLTQNWRLEEWHVASSASILQAQEFSHTSSCRLGNSLINYSRWKSTCLHTPNIFNENFQQHRTIFMIGIELLNLWKSREAQTPQKLQISLMLFCESPYRRPERNKPTALH